MCDYAPPTGKQMSLSAEQFIEAITSLTSDPIQDGADHEQRRQPRVGLRSRATIILLGEQAGSAAVSVQVRDLSPAGIGFLHEQKMNLDQQFALVLPRANDTPSVILCSVAFWQPLAGDCYAIGARFRRILRDGGNPPLPIRIETPTVDLAAEITQLHRKAG